MQRALDVALRGQGLVEPNPMVGCVLAHGAEIIGEGWHRQFGGPHAEVEALAVAGPRARGATMYVTLEPCCHQGKTPPCTRAVIAAGVARVVVAQLDPFPAVAGKGIAELQAAGIEVSCGVHGDKAAELNAPYLKLVTRGRPWVIGKWAMTLDGKIATHTGASRWISSEASRAVVHALRGRVDAIAVGRGTVDADDPELTARPAGPRTATRVILHRHAKLSVTAKVVASAREVPTLVVVTAGATDSACRQLEGAGCELFRVASAEPTAAWHELLDELGRRRMTNVLVEGGGEVLGSLFDSGELDEVHAFIAPRLFGGAKAASPIAGVGIADPAASRWLAAMKVELLGPDVYLHGRLQGPSGVKPP
ncbi:MAG: bifunctional diaminohydroxyphosphoribosylaminopyrimidine deaminase/5-amino-6-(5-phosphoribosylamino)uracil reductase RibD [Planctomycetes bacterium]|nr:bifunctional diaminohydroxyphosphoribosylaminopyrimidine deaminase/5-amino-6-(5-phosphoribosylamino)uracil reductase RibD [Planctomycetota bacterium]